MSPAIDLSRFVVDLRERHLEYWTPYSEIHPREHNSKRSTCNRWCALPTKRALVTHSPYNLPKILVMSSVVQLVSDFGGRCMNTSAWCPLENAFVCLRAHARTYSEAAKTHTAEQHGSPQRGSCDSSRNQGPAVACDLLLAS